MIEGSEKRNRQLAFEFRIRMFVKSAVTAPSLAKSSRHLRYSTLANGVSFEKCDDVHDVRDDKYKHVINYMLKILIYLVKWRNRKS